MKGLVIIALCSLAISNVLGVQYCRPTESCWPSRAIIQDFKTKMNQTQGRVMTDDDSDWVGKLLTFNQAVAEVPGLVVFVGTVDHIRDALKFAYQYNIEVRIVSSGHSFLGRCGDEGVMQISVHYMKGIDVDMSCEEHAMGCMTVQSGVQWIEAYQKADDYDRLVVGGSAPTVSVTGWTLGGGHSPMSRMFGLGVDNVLSFHLVTADLSEVWSTANGTKTKKEDGTFQESNDTSLFWALRGGGSAFGVVIDMKIKMHKTDKMGQMACTYSTIKDGVNKLDVILKSLGKLMLKAPNTFSGYILPIAACSPVYGCGGSVTVSLLHYGDLSATSPDAKWIKKFTDLPHDWTAQGLTEGSCKLASFESFYEYEMTVPNNTYSNIYIGGSLLQADFLSDSVADVMNTHYTKVYNKTFTDTRANVLGTAIWVGGAVNDVSVDDAAVHKGWRNSIFTFSSATAWDPKVVTDASAYKDDVRALHADLEPFSDGKYYNEAEQDMSPDEWKKQFWGDEMYAKLLAIKKRWDPQNRFTCRQCVGSDWNPETDNVVG